MNQSTVINDKIESLKQDRVICSNLLKSAKRELDTIQITYDNKKMQWEKLAHTFRTLDQKITEAYITKIAPKKSKHRSCNKAKKDKLPARLVKLMKGLDSEAIEKIIKKYEK